MNDQWLSEHSTKAGQIPIDIDDLIACLTEQQAQFSRYIDRRWHDLDARQLARLFSTYGQNASRLGRLLRDRFALYGKTEEFKDLISRTLDRLDAQQRDEIVGHAPPAQDDDASPQPPVDIDDVITDLADKQARLSQVLDRLWHDPDAEHLDRLLAVHSHNAVRLSRLLRDRCAIYGPPPDPRQVAINAALDRISKEWGIEL